jgi:hypothetical protein
MAGTRSGVTVAAVRRIALALPGVEEGLSYGTPGFRVRGKFLARLWEDGDVLVVKCGDTERDFRIQADPETFFVTEHYRGYPTVLVRLARVRPDELRDVLAEAWRRAAPKRLVDEYEAGPRSRSPARRAPRTARRSPRP